MNKVMKIDCIDIPISLEDAAKKALLELTEMPIQELIIEVENNQLEPLSLIIRELYS